MNVYSAPDHPQKKSAKTIRPAVNESLVHLRHLIFEGPMFSAAIGLFDHNWNKNQSICYRPAVDQTVFYIDRVPVQRCTGAPL